MTKNLFKFMCDEYIENYNKYIKYDNVIRGCSLANECGNNRKLCKVAFIANCKYMRNYHQERMQVIEEVLNDYFKYLNDEYRKLHPNTGVVPASFTHHALDYLGFINEDGSIKVDELLKHASNGLID